MGIWSTSWSRDVFFEANRFWFYALSLSLIGSIWTLCFSATSKPPVSVSTSKDSPSEKQEKQEKKQPHPDVTPLVKRIIVDGCDLVIPGSLVGWIGASPAQVGVAMAISTVVAVEDIWIKAQA